MVNPDFELLELPDDMELEEIETPVELLEASAKKDTIFNK